MILYYCEPVWIRVRFCSFASSKLSVYQNFVKLRTKPPNLIYFSYDFVSLSETKLLEGISDYKMLDNRYITQKREWNYFVIKKNRRGGSVSNPLRSSCYRTTWMKFLGSAWITVTFDNWFNNTLHVCTLCLSKWNVSISFTTQLRSFLEKLSFIVM